MADEISVDDCIHGIPSFACSICLGRPTAPPSRPFPAKYSGWCRHCQSDIRVGDMIVAEGGEYFHDECL